MDEKTRERLRRFQMMASKQQDELINNPPVTQLEQLKRFAVYHATVTSLGHAVHDVLYVGSPAGPLPIRFVCVKCGGMQYGPDSNSK